MEVNPVSQSTNLRDLSLLHFYARLVNNELLMCYSISRNLPKGQYRRKVFCFGRFISSLFFWSILLLRKKSLKSVFVNLGALLMVYSDEYRLEIAKNADKET